VRPSRIADDRAPGRVAPDLVQLAVERQIGDRGLRAADEPVPREEPVQVADEAAQVVEEERERIRRRAHRRQRCR
jgi:hypothetical protein